MGLFTATAAYSQEIIISSLADPYLKAWYDVGVSASYTSGSSRLYDLSGTGNTLFISNSAITYDAATGSLFFPGNVANYIGSNACTGLDAGYGANSMEVWFRLSSTIASTGPTYYWLASNGDSQNTLNATSGSLRSFFGDSGYSYALAINYGSGSSVSYNLPYPSAPAYTKGNSKGVWRQLVVTRDFDTVKYYVDGALSNTKTGFASQSVYLPNKIVIGKAENNTLPWIGDFSIYKQWTGKALSATEISASYAATKTRFGK